MCARAACSRSWEERPWHCSSGMKDLVVGVAQDAVVDVQFRQRPRLHTQPTAPLQFQEARLHLGPGYRAELLWGNVQGLPVKHLDVPVAEEVADRAKQLEQPEASSQD